MQGQVVNIFWISRIADALYLMHFADLLWLSPKASKERKKDHRIHRPVFISSRLLNILLFELSRSQIIQLTCVLISPKLQLAGYLVEIIIPRHLELVCKISRYWTKYPGICLMRLHQPKDSHYVRTLSKIYRARVSSFEVKPRADEDAICNFRVIPKSEIAGYLAISS